MAMRMATEWERVCRLYMQHAMLESVLCMARRHGVLYLGALPFFLPVVDPKQYSELDPSPSRMFLLQVPVHGGLHALGHHGGDELRRDDVFAEGLLL